MLVWQRFPKPRMMKNKSASIILTTHQTNEHSIGLAINSLENLDGVKEKPVLFRMFDPNGFDRKMSIVVQKFGGTSVADVDRIKQVAKRVKRTVNEGHQVVVVVSARAGVTNQLIERASAILEKSYRT